MKDFTDRREPRISREITENVRPMNLDGLELIGMDDNVYVNAYNNQLHRSSCQHCLTNSNIILTASG